MNIDYHLTDTGFLLFVAIVIICLQILLLGVVLKQNRRLKKALRAHSLPAFQSISPAVPAKDKFTALFSLLMLSIITAYFVYMAFGNYPRA